MLMPTILPRDPIEYTIVLVSPHPEILSSLKAKHIIVGYPEDLYLLSLPLQTASSCLDSRNKF
jgi:hypothetical protein